MRHPRFGSDGLCRRRRPGPADGSVDAHVRWRRGGKHAADLPPAGAAGGPAQPDAAPEVRMKSLSRYAVPLLLIVAVISAFAYLQLRSGAHTSVFQSRENTVCSLLFYK